MVISHDGDAYLVYHAGLTIMFKHDDYSNELLIYAWRLPRVLQSLGLRDAFSGMDADAKKLLQEFVDIRCRHALSQLPAVGHEFGRSAWAGA